MWERGTPRGGTPRGGSAELLVEEECGSAELLVVDRVEEEEEEEECGSAELLVVGRVRMSGEGGAPVSYGEK